MHFITWIDEQGTPATEVEALSFDGEKTSIPEPLIDAGQFVMIQCSKSGDWWFGQIKEPQRNFSHMALARGSSSTVSSFQGILEGWLDNSLFARQFHYYRVQLLRQITLSAEGDAISELRAVTRRPVDGSLGRRADEHEVLGCLGLPAVEGEQLKNNLVGFTHGMPISVPVNENTFFYHILAAGATGSGKSNTLANFSESRIGAEDESEYS